MKLKNLSSEDMEFLPACLNLLERTQGVNVSSLDYLKQLVNSPTGSLFAYFDGNNEVIAVAGAKVLENDTFDYYAPFGDDATALMKRSRVGSFCTMSVREDFQGQGLGLKLSLKREQWLKDQGCNLLVGISWVSGQSNNSARVFKKLGFRVVKEIENFFVVSSVTDALLCPVCKTPPCTCPGILFLKEV